MMKRPFLIVLIILILVTLACNVPGSASTGGEKTSVALTVIAELTQSVGSSSRTPEGGATRTVEPGLTEAPSATATLPPTAVVPPTNIPSATLTSIPCNWAKYMADLNYPDDTEVTANSGFVKTWRLQNIGSCTWTSGYQLIFSSGDQMGAPNAVSLTGGSVPPNGTVDISVNLTAPGSPGTYKGNFKIKAPDGVVFGIGGGAGGPFWVQIKVPSPAEVPQAEVPQAEPQAQQLPDLKITDITWTPAIPIKGAVTHIKVSAYNAGLGNASQFTVKWYPTSNYANPGCTWDIMEVYGGKGGRVLECDYTFISANINVNTKAEIDTSNHVTESDEGNNVFLKPIQIHNP